MSKSLQISGLRPHQIELLRKTIAKDLTREEFDLFIETAERHGLDPFRRHIVPLVLKRYDRERREMVPLVTVEGQRIIAHRCENYRPASEPTEFVLGRKLKSATNPHGIKLARVKLWRQDNLGEWFPVIGEAYWDEFAPVVGTALDPTSAWARMPRLMIAKCATSQALRAGWPDQFGAVYSEEEFDKTRILDLAASEIIERGDEERRARALAGKDFLAVVWEDGWAFDRVPIEDFFERARTWLGGQPPESVARWAEANRDALREFWGRRASEALELKKLVEARSRERGSVEGVPEPIRRRTSAPRPSRRTRFGARP